MALYAKDITQSIEPAQADVGTLGKGIQARAEGARLSANATGVMLKAAGFLAEQYVAYDVGKTQAEAEQVTSEFLDSGMRAEKAAQDVQLVTAERNKIAATGTSYSLQADAGMRKQAALGTYDQEIKRLKDAAAGGMSNEEYVSRVSALTRKAIAKYPGLADSIRERVGTITGLPYADRWAEMQYVRERFTKEAKKDSEFDPMKVVLKDIEAASAPGTFGGQKDLFDLYMNNRPEYDRRIMAFNQNKALKTGVDAVSTQISGLQAQSDLNADQLRGSFVAMFQGNLGVNVTSASVSTLENIYKPVLALMAKGENVNVNPAAFDTQIKMHNAQMKTNIEQARVASINEIDKYLANNPNITSSKRDQLKKDINDAADLQLRMYADDKGVGLAAMSTIMSNYRDKSIKEQRDLINLAIQQQAAMQNNSLVMAYWAGGDQRKNLELTNKDFYNFMVKQERILLDNTNGITSDSAGTEALRNVTTVIDAAGKNPAAVPVSADVPPENQKAAHSVMQSNAEIALNKAAKGTTLSQTDINAISSALSTNVESGPNSPILANDYKKIGDKIRLLPAESQAIIKDNVSKAARNNVMAMSSLKEGLENKHGVTLMLGVTPTGQIVAMQTPLTPKEMSAVRNGVPLSEERRKAAAKEEAAVIEFNKQSKALLSNLVFGRVMLTEEDPVAVANEFATIMNNRQPYNGFYSNAAVAPVAGSAALPPVNTSQQTANTYYTSGQGQSRDAISMQNAPLDTPAQPVQNQGNYDDQLRSILENPALDNKQRNVLIKELDSKFGTTKPVTSNALTSDEALAQRGLAGNEEMKLAIEKLEIEKRESVSTDSKRPDGTSKVVKFNPEGDGYDYETALKYGMGPDGTGENAGHWGSVAPASKEDKQKYKLPDESYVILKGRKHETWQKAVDGEQERGFEVRKFGDRYFSVPVNNARTTTGKLIDETKRPDGTSKGNGYLGVLKASDGSDVTEFSISSSDVKVKGKEIDFPTIVPTLTKAEVNLMLTDIIPNNKRIPDAIYKKAVDHAKKRIKEGKNVFAETGDYKPTSSTPATSNAPSNTSTTKKWWRPNE
jgi:hypothetical protein